MKVIICEFCKGEGKRKVPGDSWNDYSIEKCNKCNGTGRLWSLTYHYDTPFDTPLDILYKLDSEVRKFLNG